MARIIPAVVRDGVIVVEQPLDVASGTPVRVVVTEQEGELILTPEEEADLQVALDEADRDEVLSWDEVRRQLARFE